jgi:hypothetical protein
LTLGSAEPGLKNPELLEIFLNSLNRNKGSFGLGVDETEVKKMLKVAISPTFYAQLFFV